MSEDAAVNSNLTFDDVFKALGDTDPNTTNAAKLRGMLGRGGLTTIQKFLDKIRSDRAAPPADAVQSAPKMPDEFAQLWGLAWGYASLQVRTRMDAVVQERDTLAARLAAAAQDREAWEAEVQGTAGHAASLETKLVESAMAEKEAAELVAAELAATKGAAEATEARLSAELAEARHLVQITELKAQNGAQALQVTIDKLTDQVGELKSLLHMATRPESPAQ